MEESPSSLRKTSQVNMNQTNHNSPHLEHPLELQLPPTE
jgi:hypothetical protein